MLRDAFATSQSVLTQLVVLCRQPPRNLLQAVMLDPMRILAALERNPQCCEKSRAENKRAMLLPASSWFTAGLGFILAGMSETESSSDISAFGCAPHHALGSVLTSTLMTLEEVSWVMELVGATRSACRYLMKVLDENHNHDLL
jgi:hypothetical protein